MNTFLVAGRFYVGPWAARCACGDLVEGSLRAGMDYRSPAMADEWVLGRSTHRECVASYRRASGMREEESMGDMRPSSPPDLIREAARAISARNEPGDAIGAGLASLMRAIADDCYPGGIPNVTLDRAVDLSRAVLADLA